MENPLLRDCSHNKKNPFACIEEKIVQINHSAGQFKSLRPVVKRIICVTSKKCFLLGQCFVSFTTQKRDKLFTSKKIFSILSLPYLALHTVALEGKLCATDSAYLFLCCSFSHPSMIFAHLPGGCSQSSVNRMLWGFSCTFVNSSKDRSTCSLGSKH